MFSCKELSYWVDGRLESERGREEEREQHENMTSRDDRVLLLFKRMLWSDFDIRPAVVSLSRYECVWICVEFAQKFSLSLSVHMFAAVVCLTPVDTPDFCYSYFSS